MTSPIAPAEQAPLATAPVPAVEDALVESSPDEEAPDLKPVEAPLLSQPEAFEIVPSTSPAAPSELAAASSDPFSLSLVVAITVVGSGALWRLFRRASAQEASQASMRVELQGSVKALEGRIALLEGREGAAVAPESGSPVPVPMPIFDHEAMQGRMDEVEKTLARLRKKAPPKASAKRVSASKE